MQKSKAYIINSYRVQRAIHQEVLKLTKEIPFKGNTEEVNNARIACHKFLSHVYVCMRLKSVYNDYAWENIRVPFPSELLKEKLQRKVDVWLLKKHKLINWTNHSHGRGKGRCRQFWILNKHFHSIIKSHSNTAFDDWNNFAQNEKHVATVNLMSGSSMPRPNTNKNFYLNDTTKKEVPVFIKQSLACLKPCPIDPHNIIDWARKSEKKFHREKRKFLVVKKTLKITHPNAKVKELRKKRIYKNAEKEMKKAQGLYNNLVTCLSTILNRDPEVIPESNGKLWRYSAAYRLQTSGRVGEIHGGFQNIYTPAKFLLLDSVPDTYNYDISSCQAVILSYELKRWGISCRWLDKYNGNKKLRKKYADEIGITEGCWKDAFYAIIMGAEDTNFGAPFKAILNEIGDRKRTKILTDKFIKKVKPLLHACEKWRELLLNTNDKNYGFPYNGFNWKNKCEMKFKKYKRSAEDDIISIETGEIITNTKVIAKVKRKLAAFYLQGAEAYVIHWLTIKCTENNIPVYKNEHDGIITGAKIKNTLFKKIAIEAGFPTLEIKNKSICKESKMEGYEEYTEL